MLKSVVEQTYPIPNTKQGIPLPLLRHNAHLRSRKQDMASVLNIRSEMHWAMTNHFRVRWPSAPPDCPSSPPDN